MCLMTDRACLVSALQRIDTVKCPFFLLFMFCILSKPHFVLQCHNNCAVRFKHEAISYLLDEILF